MDELQNQIKELRQQIEETIKQLKVEALTGQLNDLRTSAQQAGLWDNSTKAQSVMKQIAGLESRIEPWHELETNLADLEELLKLNDQSLKKELSGQLEQVSHKFDSLKQALKLAGPYDDHGAIVSLHAGAGGTDAQDWTQMLFRMYSRFFENNRWKVTVVDESPGEEAGLKSITMEVEGPFAYGKLKGEHGVHRLVRLSPFNADHLRQTSFAKVEVSPMIDQPGELEISDKDLKVDVYRSGGHGGQSVNTTDSAVRVTHLPTAINVSIQNERSQLQNRETAMTILRSRLIQLQLEQHAEKLSELKGQNQSAEWGNQIRSYVLHPYKQVKDLRTSYETNAPDAVLDGDLDPFINAYLEQSIQG